MPCIDCVDGYCTMNCGAMASPPTIFKTPVCYVAQDTHGEVLAYRVMSANNICLFESVSPAKAIAYAEWFAESKTARDARAAIKRR